MPSHVQSYYYNHLTASGVVKANAGVLHTLTAGQTGSIIVYDDPSSASGSIIYSGTITAGDTITLDVEFNTGCYIALTTVTDLTASYA